MYNNSNQYNGGELIFCNLPAKILSKEAENFMSNTFVCLMGLGTVFVGLISIIILCTIMSGIVRLAERGKKKSEPQAAAVQPEAPVENRQEIIAAVCAAIAEEEGTDISALRVLSFKKI